MAKAIYIHIPFCSHICYYCDFNKVFLEGQPVDDYIEACCHEFALYAEELAAEEIQTVYVGGGTPSTLTSAQIEKLFMGLKKYTHWSPNIEVTFEMNPNDITTELLNTLKRCGINRLSIGVQAFDNALLKRIGRQHSAEEALEALQIVKASSFTNVSIDLIFGLPRQSYTEFEHTLDIAFRLNLPHYSIYSLILENKTVFYNLMRQGKLNLPTQDEEAEMFQLVIARMQAEGFDHYEISNYGKPGYESKHNLIYWANEEYFGFGAGAHGYLSGRRYQNFGPIQHYLQGIRSGSAVLREKVLTQAEQIEEEMFLGLRRRKGVDLDHFEAKFKLDAKELYAEQIARLKEEGLLMQKGQQIALTPHGLFLGNEAFQEFLLT